MSGAVGHQELPAPLRRSPATRRRSRATAATTAAVCLAVAPVIALAGCGPAPSARDLNWQQDVAYMARKLPHYGVLVQLTTKVINPQRTRYGTPDIDVAPTVHDWLTGRDPVLAKALAYATR